MRYKESDASEEKNKSNFRVEWKDDIRDFDYENFKAIHKGPNSTYFEHDYDSAYNLYIWAKHNPEIIEPKLIEIDCNGNEIVMFG